MSFPPQPTTDLARAREQRDAEDQRLMWLFAMVAFAVGAVTCLAVLGLPDPDTSDHARIAAVAGVLGLSGAALALTGPRSLPVRLSPFWGVLCISALVASARPLGAMPLFYLWPVLQAAYFLDRRRLVAVQGTMLVTYAAALQFSPPGLRTAYFLAVVVCATMVGAVVSHLKQRVNGLMAGLDAAASTDPLTGLLNRRAFETAFETELVRARRSGRPLTLAVFDLDHFKSVNDHFGHDVGDTALCRTAATLDQGRRSSDVVARVGGEEFAVLFVDADGTAGHEAAARIAERLGEWSDADVVHLSLSAGVAEFGGALQGRVDMMRAADAALYQAKAAGRRRVVSDDGQVTLTGEPAPVLTADSRTFTPSAGT